MSDTTRTILWIALAVVVIALIAWVMASSRRRRAAEERTFRTGELRAQPEPSDRPTAAPDRPVVQESQRAATQPGADATPEPAASDDHSRTVTEAAASGVGHDDSAESPAATPRSQQQEATVAEPDGDVNDHDHDHDHEDDGRATGAFPAGQDEQAQGPERAQPRGASAAAAGAFGGASTLDHDDEPDLADADDPFSSSREPQSPGEPSAQQDTSDREQSRANGYERRMNETSSNAAGGHFDDGHTVSVPALDEAKEALTDGGTPGDDAGDHRGQAWSTSPGSASLDTESGTDERDAVEDIDAQNTAQQPVESARAPEPASGDDQRHGADDSRHDAGHGAEAGDASDRSRSDDDTDLDVDDGSAARDRADNSDDRADRADRDSTADDEAVGARVGGGEDHEAHDTASGDEQGEVSSEVNSEGRRVSGFDEVSDGGYGLGSAASIADGAQPLGHPVKAWHDRKSFVGPDDEGYDGSEPDVWFYSADAARRAGFSGPGD